MFLKRSFILAVAFALAAANVATAATELLDFTATWCGPCQQMGPVVDRLAAEGYQVRKVDFDRQRDLANKYGVKNIPCFIVLRDGRESGRVVGRTNYDQLRRLLQPQHPPRYRDPRPQQPTPAWRYERIQGKYRSVVRVVANEGDGKLSKGSGCAIRWGKRVVIVTAYHVVKGSRAIYVKGKTRYRRCKLVGHDTTYDVAILEPDTPTDFELAEIAWAETGNLKIGERLESCGFGGDERLAVNGGRLLKFWRPNASNTPDWLLLSGPARQGDSGGPVFNQSGKLVGVLWGTDGETVVATQCGRLHEILKRSLGPCYVEQRYGTDIVYDRPVVPVQPRQAGLLDGRPLCAPLRPRTPEPAPAPPNITVQADPRVGDSLVAINSKLDTVVANTTPAAVEPEPKPETKKKPELPPFIMFAVIGGGVALGFVVYFATQKGA